MALTIAMTFAVAVFWLTGFAAGYGVREYISRRRRNQARWSTVFDREFRPDVKGASGAVDAGSREQNPSEQKT